jgi:hypothetical protein
MVVEVTSKLWCLNKFGKFYRVPALTWGSSYTIKAKYTFSIANETGTIVK